MKVIIFSKDRALQLDAFLRSYRDNVKFLKQVHVLYRTTSDRHEKAYQELFHSTSWVLPLRQGQSFREDLLYLLLLNNETNVIFFVDDQIFLRSWTIEETPGLSLRLGMNLISDYNSALRVQPLPMTFAKPGVDTLSWRWSEGIGAWSYPLSLDGHVFDLNEFQWMIQRISFHSPNTLELGLQQFLYLYAQRYGVCYVLSKVVNVPWNQVQTDWSNRHGDGNDSEEMLKHWEAGQRIAVKQLYGVVNESTHQEFPLALEAVA